MTSPDPDDLPNRDQQRHLVSVIEEDAPSVDTADPPDANNVAESGAESESAPDEVAALEDALARAVRRAERERAKRRSTVEREQAKRADITARAEKAAGRLGDVKAELRKSRKTVEKSTAKVQREHDARERAEHERAEWKQRARAITDELATETALNGDLHDELQELRNTLAAEATRLETATIEVGELRAELVQAGHDHRAAADEAARLREQLLRLHTELGRVLPARYLRRLGLG